ncbi:NBR1-Ig-like domain-containing protein, partial [Nanoarchaeota archaeon]
MKNATKTIVLSILSVLFLLSVSFAASAASSGFLKLTDLVNLNHEGWCDYESDRYDCDKAGTPAMFWSQGRDGCGNTWSPGGCTMYRTSDFKIRFNINDVNGGKGTLYVWTTNYGGGSWDTEKADIYLNGDYVGRTPDYWCYSSDCQDRTLHRIDFDDVEVKGGENVIRFKAVDDSFAIHAFKVDYNPHDNNAKCISHTIPASIVAGTSQQVSVTMKNTGTTAWKNNRGYKLGLKNPQDNPLWGITRVSIPNAPVNPGQTATFTFTIKAPSTPGEYANQWKMVQEQLEWFGEKCGRTSVTVQSANTPPVLANLPDKSYPANAGFKNNIIDLYQYASDGQDNDNQLTFEVVSNSDPNVASCTVDQDRYIDCTIKNKIGATNVKVKVTDRGGLKDTDSFKITTYNTPPVLENLPDKSYPANAGFKNNIMDLYKYANDLQDTDAQLTFSITSSIHPDVATCVIDQDRYVDCTIHKDIGYTDIQIKVKDRQNAIDKDTFRITTTNTAPTLAALPEKGYTANSGFKNNIVDLWAYAADGQDTDQQLSFSIVGNSDPNVATCYIDADRYVDCTILNKVSSTNVRIRVTDRQGATAERNLKINALNSKPIFNNIPGQTFPVSSGFQNNIIDLFQHASDQQDTDQQLTFSLISNSDPAVAVCNIQNDRYVDCTIGDKIGSTTFTFRATDRHGGKDDATFVLSTDALGELEIVSIECFPYVIQGHEQDCSVYVEVNNDPISGATVQLYKDETFAPIGTCTTDSISGGCKIQFIENVLGSHTVYAHASKSGYQPDNDGQPTYTYNVLKERYDIRNLNIYNDSGYTQEDDDFFRGENLYASFQVWDMVAQQYISTDIVTEVTLVSSPGGRITLTRDYPPSVGGYYYKLEPIPPTHDFLGESHVFAFSFNFSDNSGGEEVVDVWIRNNPPVIVEPVPDITTTLYDTVTLDLTPYESDVEDSGVGLVWEPYSTQLAFYEVSINEYTDVLTLTPRAIGQDGLGLKLIDLDEDFDTTIIQVTIRAAQCEDDIDNDGDDLIDENDPGCWTDPTDPDTYDHTDDDESDGTTQCRDNVDNDGDDLIDEEDPGCWTDITDPSTYDPNDNDESDATTQCQDTIDNDGDNLIDAQDPGCWTDRNDPDTYDPSDNDESDSTTECQDGVDNDGDGLIDYPNDPGCDSPQDNDESDGTSQCQDGIDNDGDGLIDYPNDPGCSSPQDDDESDGTSQCQDGVDNDGDGLIDYPNDPGCDSPQ